MNIYMFVRKDGFYPIELNSDLEAIANAIHNDGTIKVEDINGNVIWPIDGRRYMLAIETVDFVTKGKAYLVKEEEPTMYYVIDDTGNESIHRKSTFVG